MLEKAVEILLVEDNPDDASLIVETLKQHHADVHVELVHDGATALDYLFGTGAYAHRKSGSTPSLIMLDLHLPKVSGAEVLRIVKAYARTSAIPVVMLTTSPQEHVILESYQLGANSFVHKPHDAQAFREAIRSIGYYWLTVNRASDREAEAQTNKT
jgi:two-component system, response regulator